MDRVGDLEVVLDPGAEGPRVGHRVRHVEQPVGVKPPAALEDVAGRQPLRFQILDGFVEVLPHVLLGHAEVDVHPDRDVVGDVGVLAVLPGLLEPGIDPVMDVLELRAVTLLEGLLDGLPVVEDLVDGPEHGRHSLLVRILLGRHVPQEVELDDPRFVCDTPQVADELLRRRCLLAVFLYPSHGRSLSP